MFVKKVLMIVLVSVIYLINLNIPVAAEENEQPIREVDRENPPTD